ncbi:MAG: thiamine-phosphate kinase [Bacteroidetes bacterium]|nr:thiamine-phosphate kinase [Bacteroidota bacterium]
MSKAESKLTELSELGEFGLIDYLTKNIPIVNESTIKGIGDDAAVLKPTADHVTLLSKDLLIEGVHFDLTYMPLKHLGYKAAVVNFSDIVAMNGIPKQMIVGLGVSSKFSVEALEEIYAGIKKACEVYQVDFVGGDTTSSISGLFISVTVVGEIGEDKVTYRSGADVNDLLCVSGDLGGAYMGLLVLEREKQVFKVNPDMQPDLSQHNYILERQLKPEARKDIIKLFDEKGIVPTSMIDISDGLASEALHICMASKKGCMIYEEKIPIDQNTYDTAKEFNIIPSVAALNGGEDYELLFTIKQEDYDKIKEVEGVTVIGYITDESEGEKLVSNDNQLFKLEAQGWDALKKRELDNLTSDKTNTE